MAMYFGRVIQDQHKEPALSAPLVDFTNPQADTFELPYTLPEEIKDYTGADYIAIARGANIIDEIDGKLLYKKLERAATENNVAIVINAVDDEPYVSSRISPLINYRKEVVGGISFCQAVAGNPDSDVHITVYRHMMHIDSNIPAQIEGYKVTRLGGGFPARPTITQIRTLQHRPVLTIGVGAIIFMYRAVTEHKRQTSTFLTVHGGAVANPMNLEVSFDMNITQVLERCGLAHAPTRVVLGGSMTGIAALDTGKTLVTPTTRAVLAFVQQDKDLRYACIGCGRCEQDCPAGLSPVYIYKFMRSGYHNKLCSFSPQDCIGCGVCSYVCPSRIPVAVAVKRAKTLVDSGQVTPPEPSITWGEIATGLKKAGRAIYRLLAVIILGIVTGLTAAAKAVGKFLGATGRMLRRGYQKIAAGVKSLSAKAKERAGDRAVEREKAREKAAKEEPLAKPQIKAEEQGTAEPEKTELEIADKSVAQDKQKSEELAKVELAKVELAKADVVVDKPISDKTSKTEELVSKISTTEGSTAKDFTTKDSTAKASTTKGSTTKDFTTKASTAKDATLKKDDPASAPLAEKQASEPTQGQGDNRAQRSGMTAAAQGEILQRKSQLQIEWLDDDLTEEETASSGIILPRPPSKGTKAEPPEAEAPKAEPPGAETHEEETHMQIELLEEEEDASREI